MDNLDKHTFENDAPTELYSRIRGLKQRIGRLKNQLEHPDYNESAAEKIEDIESLRKQLVLAKQMYSQKIGDYPMSNKEQAIDMFERNLQNVSKIVLTIGGFFAGYPHYVADFSDDFSVYKEYFDSKEMIHLLDKLNRPYTKVSFLAEFNNIHVEEWNKSYSLRKFGYEILDGTQWELKIYYSNDIASLNYSGNNHYPYNFEQLLQLFNAKEMS